MQPLVHRGTSLIYGDLIKAYDDIACLACQFGPFAMTLLETVDIILKELQCNYYQRDAPVLGM